MSTYTASTTCEHCSIKITIVMVRGNIDAALRAAWENHLYTDHGAEMDALEADADAR